MLKKIILIAGVALVIISTHIALFTFKWLQFRVWRELLATFMTGGLFLFLFVVKTQYYAGKKVMFGRPNFWILIPSFFTAYYTICQIYNSLDESYMLTVLTFIFLLTFIALSFVKFKD